MVGVEAPGPNEDTHTNKLIKLTVSQRKHLEKNSAFSAAARNDLECTRYLLFITCLDNEQRLLSWRRRPFILWKQLIAQEMDAVLDVASSIRTRDTRGGGTRSGGVSVNQTDTSAD